MSDTVQNHCHCSRYHPSLPPPRCPVSSDKEWGIEEWEYGGMGMKEWGIEEWEYGGMGMKEWGIEETTAFQDISNKSGQK